jgi:competence protein ComFC
MLRNYLKALQDILIPRLCFHCAKKIPQGVICRECLGLVEPAKQAAQLPAGALYNRLICAVEYKEPVITLIHRFKYSHCDYLAGCLAEFMVQSLARFPANADLITCVPTHPQKLKARGYNPPGLLARSLANYFKIPFADDIIYEYAYRPSQTALTREKRSHNPENAFGAKDTCRGKDIALVDDVFTTGSTINGCCRALRKQGAGTITAITLARSL